MGLPRNAPLPRTEKIWFNGALVPWEEANIHVLTHALHYGTGVFEGIRCYDTRQGPCLFRLPEHIDRLFQSAALYRMKLPYTRAQWAAAIKETIRANKLKSCYVRPIAFYGYHDMGVHPKGGPVVCAVAAWPWGTYLGAEGLEKGIRCTISPWRRFHSTQLPTMAKATGQYLNAMLAKVDAIEKGFDEAIMLDASGFVSEGPGENIFVARRGALYTPGLEYAPLPGITRDTVMALASDLGHTVVEKAISVDELLAAEEAFFTGTAAEVTPIREIDMRPIGSGKAGPVTKRIQKRFFDVVRAKEEKYLKWLEPANRK